MGSGLRRLGRLAPAVIALVILRFKALAAGVLAPVAGMVPAALPALTSTLARSLLQGTIQAAVGVLGVVVVVAGVGWLVVRTLPGAPSLAPPPIVARPGHEASRIQPHGARGAQNNVFALGPLNRAGAAGQQAGQSTLGPAQPRIRQPLQPAQQEPPGTPARLALDLGINIDFRHLRYTVTYVPAMPVDSGAPRYLHHGRVDPAELEIVPARQITDHPEDYGWSDGPPRLCTRGLRLDAEHPICFGVVRVAMQRTAMRTTTSPLDFFATRVATLGLPHEDAMVEGSRSTLRARRVLALKEALFVSFASLTESGSALFMLARQPDDPSAWRPTYLRGFGDGRGLSLPGEQVDELQLSRDRTRLYLGTRFSVYEWTGTPRARPRILLDAHTPHLLAGMAVLDRRVCVVQQNGHRAAALRCRSQGSSQWDEPAPIPHTVDAMPFNMSMPFVLAAHGNSLLITNRQGFNMFDLPASWIPDASEPSPRMHALTLERSARSPGRAVNGVVALSGAGDAPAHYLVFGQFPSPRRPFAHLALFQQSTPHGPRAEVASGAVFGEISAQEPAPRHVAIWRRPGGGVVRIFSSGMSITSTFHALNPSRQLRRQHLRWSPTWRDHNAFSLLDNDDGSRTLVAGGRELSGGGRLGLLIQRIPGFMAMPEAGHLIPFDQALEQLDAVQEPSAFCVEHVTPNALVLAPHDA